MTATADPTAPYTTKISYRDQDPRDLAPNGDRYIVELLDIDDSVFIGESRLFTPGLSETERGWKAARVIAVGNGHRLESDATVPMFYKPGDVLLIERLTGRELTLRGKKYLILNQVDVLARFTGVP
jgi:co-chaperonin GroES (HSP10)